MLIGCPRERKADEYRVGLTPGGVKLLHVNGHTVRIEAGAGVGSGYSDRSYREAGAEIAGTLAEIYAADIVIKVKEPIPEEYPLLNSKTLLFCYLHLAAIPQLADVLVKQQVTAVAFETITADDGSLPLLTPMSMVAGRLAVQVGAACLQKDHGGKGILLPGLPGVHPGRVVIIGGGVVGHAALQVAVGFGARVTVLDTNAATLRHLDTIFSGRIETVVATPDNIADVVQESDLLIGAVLVPGAKAPKVVTRAMLATMEPGSVAVDVAVDQGGCFETTKPTTHSRPTYVEEGVIHYAVANMPSIVSRTSTIGLANATFPVLLRLAANPVSALREPHIANGLMSTGGAIVHPKVAEALGFQLHGGNSATAPVHEKPSAGPTVISSTDEKRF
jgi:alanine dehydrogenase